jgi:hypothetical protein
MIAVEVREKDVVEVERDSVAHHLALRAFTAIEQECFSITEKGDGRDVAFDGRSCSGSA